MVGGRTGGGDVGSGEGGGGADLAAGGGDQELCKAGSERPAVSLLLGISPGDERSVRSCSGGRTVGSGMP